jgi:hypothetical protein
MRLIDRDVFHGGPRNTRGLNNLDRLTKLKTNLFSWICRGVPTVMPGLDSSSFCQAFVQFLLSSLRTIGGSVTIEQPATPLSRFPAFLAFRKSLRSCPYCHAWP